MKDNKYTYDETYRASLEYFNGNDLAAKVFVDKYALRDNDNNYRELTPHDMHDRLAREFAKIDSKKYGLNYDKRLGLYRDAMDKFARVCVQGSPMSAIGNPYQYMSASNCVVIESPKDDVGSIMRTGETLAQLYKRRAGVGLCLSNLRPEGEPVSNAAKTTTGAWSFADYYSYVTNIIGQKSRRGALIVTLDVHHPDVMKFATCKHDETKVTGANISIKLSNEFMEAVENDTEYEQRWPCTGTPKITKMVRARNVWDEIINSATKTGDPGLLFWDTVKKNLPADYYDEFKTQCVNPCAELPMSEKDSCRLISINLTSYVIDPFKKGARFDFESFSSDVRLTTHMIDNLVDIEINLVERIKGICTKGHEKEIWMKLQKNGEIGRRAGLGTHGLADTLAQLKIRYDSNDGVSMVDKIYESLRNETYAYSVELAKVRGAFPIFDWDKEKKCPFIQNLPANLKKDIKKYGRRNISILTQAPTGSISIISRVGNFNRFNVSSGVEPVFRVSYNRSRKINPDDEDTRVDRIDKNNISWQDFKVFHSNVSNYMEATGNSGDNLPNYFVTADKIEWEKRLEIQSAEQKYIDHSISSTINLPKGTPPSLVKQIYMAAWKKDLKGITIYVDGSKSMSVLSENVDGRPKSITPSEAPKRPNELICDIMHGTVNGEKWTMLVGLLKNDPYEIFMGRSKNFNISAKYTEGKITKQKRGQYCLLDQTNNILLPNIVKTAGNKDGAWTTRMLSTSLRHGVPIEYLIEQLSKDGSIVDINNVIARLLKKYEKKRKSKQEESCPQCGSHELVREEGCKKCVHCGWGKCS